MLKLEELHAYYDKSHILHGVRFAIQSPSIVALLWRWTGDDRFRDDLYDFAVRNLRYVVRTLDADNDGWPEGLGNVERSGMGPEKLDNAVYFIRGLYDLADMARAKHDGRDRDHWKCTEGQKHCGAGDARRAQRGGATDESAAQRPEIGDERDVDISRFERKNGSGDDLRAVEHERPLPGAECRRGPSDRGLEATDRLPRDAARLAALDAQQFVLFDVVHECRLDALDVSLHHALRGGGSGPRHAVDQARGIGNTDARALLEDRLLQVALGNADFLAERQDLVGREMLPLVLGRLQLRCALENALQGCAVDAGGRTSCHPASVPPFFASSGVVRSRARSSIRN